MGQRERHIIDTSKSAILFASERWGTLASVDYFRGKGTVPSISRGARYFFQGRIFYCELVAAALFISWYS